MAVKGPWILTQSTRKFDLANPKPSQVSIEDIAAGLSRICRFNGQLKSALDDVIYSVAQHSVYVKRYLEMIDAPKKARPWGLLHDAPEAFYGDVTSPLKSLLPEYSVYEERGAVAVRERFSVPYDAEVIKHVKYADKQLVLMESVVVTSMPSRLWDMPEESTHTMKDLDPDFYPWSPAKSRQEFLKEFSSLELE